MAPSRRNGLSCCVLGVQYIRAVAEGVTNFDQPALENDFGRCRPESGDQFATPPSLDPSESEPTQPGRNPTISSRPDIGGEQGSLTDDNDR